MDLPRGLAGVVIDQTSISSTKNARLTYSGYPIEEICQASFEEVVYLLWYGRAKQRGIAKVSQDACSQDGFAGRNRSAFVVYCPRTAASDEHPAHDDFIAWDYERRGAR